MLKVYNTLSRKLDEFKPIDKGKIRFYHCGPTVYWTQHIGNLRGMAMGDLIRRSLIYLGYEVKYVRNYTDFGHLTSDADVGEDKMEKGAKREGLTPEEVADKYIAQFERDTEALNLLEPTIKARATDYIDDMIKMIEVLVEKGYAYVTPKAIYFEVAKFPNYTELSRRNLEKDKAGAGFGSVQDSDKKDPADFALWFFKTGAHENALQYWPSPFESPEVENGEGIPGWHLECSTMANVNLGATLDIHMGGVEHISIHHPNEIAQSESANGVKYVNYWIHNEHLMVDGEKMSKSLGNVYNLASIVEKAFTPMDLRYFYLQAQYRSKQNFTTEALEGAKNAYKKMVDRVRVLNQNIEEKGSIDKSFKNEFVKTLEDDFNIPEALAVSWELLKADINDNDKLATILDFDRVLGLNLLDKAEKEIEIPEEVEKLLKRRKEARENKEWEKSDEFRDKLENDFNIKVKDTEEGQIIDTI
ncbi:cysteine--tRNA ligase [Candidatus Dojkabacteria bacterium]|nr:cysteine--tRNA ligase [Candidatus Dojkabacteria bacterium]